jgi:hypothetical protein
MKEKIMIAMILGILWNSLAIADTPIISNDRVFTFAEANYPAYFPGSATDQQSQQYTYRYYPSTMTYLAVDTSGVISMLGLFTKNVITVVGPVSTFTDAIIAWEATIPHPINTYKIGDTGPAGGVVFYVDKTGTHGLETHITSTSSSDVNIALSKNADIESLWKDASALASSYGAGWRLPTTNELKLLFLGTPAFNEKSFYWLSNSLDSLSYWVGIFTYTKSAVIRVRAVQDF